MDYKSWRKALQQDADNLELLILMVADITPEHDTKLQTLFRLLDDKMAHPINPGNKKVIIFTAFSDTAGYLYEHVSEYMKIGMAWIRRSSPARLMERRPPKA